MRSGKHGQARWRTAPGAFAVDPDLCPFRVRFQGQLGPAPLELHEGGLGAAAARHGQDEALRFVILRAHGQGLRTSGEGQGLPVGAARLSIGERDLCVG